FHVTGVQTCALPILLNALYLAANYPIAEVALFFNNQLFRGNRATKADANGFNAFASPNFPPLLEAGIHISLVAGKLSQTKLAAQIGRAACRERGEEP